jgi:hypothetical protein
MNEADDTYNITIQIINHAAVKAASRILSSTTVHVPIFPRNTWASTIPSRDFGSVILTACPRPHVGTIVLAAAVDDAKLGTCRVGQLRTVRQSLDFRSRIRL